MPLHARTPLQERILDLYYDFSPRDIAKRLGITTRAVNVHLRAMRRGPTQGTTVCGCLQDYLQRPLEESHVCPHQVAV